MEKLISNEICMKILQNYLQTSNSIKFISFEVKPISEDAEGFMGEHYKLVTHYEFGGEQKSQTFFVKNKPIKNKVQEEITDSLGFYMREIFVYEVLLREFEKHGYDRSFAAKSFYCIPEQTLVMEDVTLKGFSITDRHSQLTVDHLKCALKSLALYHGAGYALEKTKSKQLNKNYILTDDYNNYMNELIFVQYIDQSMYAMNWWTGCIKTLNVLIDLLPQNESYKQDFKKMFNNYELGKSFVTDTNIKKTCGHGDLWSNNMLFKYENKIPVQCCLVDFQICRYSYPCYDVLLAIYCNTDAQFRKKHLEDLYLYYYNALAETLKNYSCNITEIHPLEDFYKSIDLVKVEALMQMLLTNIILYLPKEKLTEYVNDDEAGFKQLMFDNHELAADAFQNDEQYRKVLSDNIYELRDALIKKKIVNFD